jgi:hypothetical protein
MDRQSDIMENKNRLRNGIFIEKSVLVTQVVIQNTKRLA